MKTKIPLLPAVLGSAVLLMTGCVVPADYAVTTVRHEPGYTTRTLPGGYRTVNYSGNRYYVHGDTYYRQRNGGYVVVSDPHRHGSPRRGDTWVNPRTGAVVKELPNGYRVTNHRGTRYYVYRDTYYRPRRGGYIVVDRPY